jgi:hypothetical protein
MRERAVHDLPARPERREARDVAVGRVPRGVAVEPEGGRDEEDAIRAAAQFAPEAVQLVTACHLLQCGPSVRGGPEHERRWPEGPVRQDRRHRDDEEGDEGPSPRVGARGHESIDDHAGAEPGRPERGLHEAVEEATGLDRRPPAREDPHVAGEYAGEQERQRGQQGVEGPSADPDGDPGR